jgi:hypothetical protein
MSWRMAGPGIAISFQLRMRPNLVQFPRCASSNVVDTKIQLWLSFGYTRSWLSQANHIFSRLGITSDFETYGMSIGPHESAFALIYWQLFWISLTLSFECRRLQPNRPEASYFSAQ